VGVLMPPFELTGTKLDVAVNLALITAQVLFGGYHVLGKGAFNYIKPIVFCFYREIMAGPTLVILAAVVERRILDVKQDWWRFILLGATGVYGNQLLFNLGLYYTSPTQAAIMQPCIPVFTAAIALIIRVEKFNILKIIGILFAAAGAVVMAGFEDLSLKSDRSIGMLCLLGNTLVMAIYLILQKEVLKKYPPISVTGWAYMIGAVFMGLTTLYYAGEPVYQINQKVILPLMYSVLLATTLAYLLITWGNKHAPSTVVASYNCLQPLTAAILSYFFLGDVIVWRQGVGAAGIGIGLFFVTFARWRESKDAAIKESKQEIYKMPDPKSNGLHYQYSKNQDEAERVQLLSGTLLEDEGGKRLSYTINDPDKHPSLNHAKSTR